MIDTILFDLDGTLLRFTQKAFIDKYFAELSKVFDRIGLDADRAAKAVWAGTEAMTLNDGNCFNKERFWDSFGGAMGIGGARLEEIEAACDSFYANEFNAVKSIVDQSDIPKRIVWKLKQKGYNLVLATNPLFPFCGVKTRLAWCELDECTFSLVTHYGNSKFCKPNLEYYREILAKISKAPQQCRMIGNNPAEDMVASELGMEVFLVTDYLEEDDDTDITVFRRGSLVELEATLSLLPAVRVN